MKDRDIGCITISVLSLEAQWDVWCASVLTFCHWSSHTMFVCVFILTVQSPNMCRAVSRSGAQQVCLSANHSFLTLGWVLFPIVHTLDLLKQVQCVYDTLHAPTIGTGPAQEFLGSQAELTPFPIHLTKSPTVSTVWPYNTERVTSAKYNLDDCYFEYIIYKKTMWIINLYFVHFITLSLCRC